MVFSLQDFLRFVLAGSGHLPWDDATGGEPP